MYRAWLDGRRRAGAQQVVTHFERGGSFAQVFVETAVKVGPDLRAREGARNCAGLLVSDGRRQRRSSYASGRHFASGTRLDELRCKKCARLGYNLYSSTGARDAGSGKAGIFTLRRSFLGF